MTQKYGDSILCIKNLHDNFVKNAAEMRMVMEKWTRANFLPAIGLGEKTERAEIGIFFYVYFLFHEESKVSDIC